MIVTRGHCSFCMRHADECRGGLYLSRDFAPPSAPLPERICIYCVRKAFREFGEARCGSAEVVVLHRREKPAPIVGFIDDDGSAA